MGQIKNRHLVRRKRKVHYTHGDTLSCVAGPDGTKCLMAMPMTMVMMAMAMMMVMMAIVALTMKRMVAVKTMLRQPSRRNNIRHVELTHQPIPKKLQAVSLLREAREIPRHHCCFHRFHPPPSSPLSSPNVCPQTRFFCLPLPLPFRLAVHPPRPRPIHQEALAVGWVNQGLAGAKKNWLLVLLLPMFLNWKDGTQGASAMSQHLHHSPHRPCNLALSARQRWKRSPPGRNHAAESLMETQSLESVMSAKDLLSSSGLLLMVRWALPPSKP